MYFKNGCNFQNNNLPLSRILTTGVFAKYSSLVHTCRVVGTVYLYNYPSLVSFSKIVGKYVTSVQDKSQRNDKYTCII